MSIVLQAIIMRVLSMTPEQINVLPPNERATYIQLVLLGLFFIDGDVSNSLVLFI